MFNRHANGTDGTESVPFYFPIRIYVGASDNNSDTAPVCLFRVCDETRERYKRAAEASKGYIKCIHFLTFKTISAKRG